MTSFKPAIGIVSLVMCALLSGCQPSVVENTLEEDKPVDGKTAEFTGVLADGAHWRAQVPASFNGTVLLYGHGYKPALQSPDVAPRGSDELLLDSGYALVASQYPQAGWAVEVAVPSQLLALDALITRIGEPERVIAFGSSMGGLVTAALAEFHSDKIDGAMTLCASAYGALPMMNMAFDGAYAIATLIAPELDFSPVGRGDNFAQVKALMAVVDEARQTPLGRARVMLAGVLAGIPDWTQTDTQLAELSTVSQKEEQIAQAILRGVFLPRGDQEARAGGVFSGNADIDYQTLLAASGRIAQVEQMYALAGYDLHEDLLLLNNGPRVKPDEGATEYMQRHFTPSGEVGVPVLNVHTMGDGMTSPALQFAYTRLVQHTSGENMANAYWLERAGHCTQSGEEVLALVKVLETRLETGQWTSVDELINPDSNSHTFTRFTSFPVPRACSSEPWQCPQVKLQP